MPFSHALSLITQSIFERAQWKGLRAKCIGKNSFCISYHMVHTGAKTFQIRRKGSSPCLQECLLVLRKPPASDRWNYTDPLKVESTPSPSVKWTGSYRLSQGPLEKARLVVVKGPMRIFFRHTKEVTGALEMAQLEVIIFKLHLESCFCWKTLSFITSRPFQLSNKSTQPTFMVRTETNFVWWRQANIIC